jgi:hypothetical protein
VELEEVAVAGCAFLASTHSIRSLQAAKFWPFHPLCNSVFRNDRFKKRLQISGADFFSFHFVENKTARTFQSAPFPRSSCGFCNNCRSYFLPFLDDPVGTVTIVCKMRLQIL